MSSVKSIVIDLVGVISTQFSRRGFGSIRAGFAVTSDDSQNEYLLSPGDTRTLTGITTIAMISTDSDTVDTIPITATIHKGAGTVTVSVKQILVLSGAIDSIVITNTSGVGSDPIRVKAVIA